MTPQSSPAPGTRAALLALVTGLGMAATVLTALGFEHIGGYIPCALCLKQRIPYYLACPLAFLAAGALFMKAPKWVGLLLMLAVSGLMVLSLGLGIYHAGVEWGWWLGPTDCAAAAGNITTSNADDLLSQLQNTRPPSCDEAAGRFLGLSFAGWNVIASVLWLALCAGALMAIRKPD